MNIFASAETRRCLRAAGPVALYWRHRLRPRASYAGDGEDQVVGTLLDGVARFIDIGANDGISCSNTALFALRGAAGLCFEPNPEAFARLRSFYACARRIECVPQGLSESSGSLKLRCDGLLSNMPVTEDPALTALLEGYVQSGARVIDVQVERLGTWLERRPDFFGCDLLSLDVEGHELSVLKGVDWERHPKPARCMIVETHAAGPQGAWRHRDFEAIAGLLECHGYCRTAASANNTIWLHRDDHVRSRIAAAKQYGPGYEWL